MKGPKNHKPEASAHSTRNTLTLGVFVGICAGFVISILLGMTEIHRSPGAPEWIQAISSVAAVLISGLAVFLVSQTLAATRDMLIETRRAVEHEERIGEAQTRPYLLYSHQEISHDELFESANFAISIKNFGSTPASSVKISAMLTALELVDIDGQNKNWCTVDETQLHNRFYLAFPPNNEERIDIFISNGIIDFEFNTYVEIDVSYYTHDKSHKYQEHITFSVSKEDGRFILTRQ